MTPKDVREFATTKHDGLPGSVSENKQNGGDKDSTEVSLPRRTKLALAFFRLKMASMESSLHKVESAVANIGRQRRQNLAKMVQNLSKENVRLKEQTQKATMQAQQAEQAGQQAASAAESQATMAGPTPPPSQTPYGAMLQQPQQGQQQGAK